MKFYVYELSDPRDGKVFYVGKGKEGRINQHERDARNGVQSAKCDMIRAIEGDNLRIGKRKVKFFTKEHDAYVYEARLIRYYGLENLTNKSARVAKPLRFTRPPTMDKASKAKLAEDRAMVTSVAAMMQTIHRKQLDLSAVNVAGVATYDLRQVVNEFLCKVKVISDQRGADWANSIAKRYGVEFAG